ncbi:MAG: hypothetical protein MJZ26_11410 [Fibrobacter sp.]|nr:hypothetical protein [Fibrobacter sp.]
MNAAKEKEFDAAEEKEFARSVMSEKIKEMIKETQDPSKKKFLYEKLGKLVAA